MDTDEFVSGDVCHAIKRDAAANSGAPFDVGKEETSRSATLSPSSGAKFEAAW
jgi:hypothetical protein